MDGYLLYRQYLDNICDFVTVYKIPRYKEKNILEVLSLSKKIEDLGYLDEIFANAGEPISYLGNKEFMSKNVIIVSKLETMIDLSYLDNSMQKSMKEKFREDIDDEEGAIEELQTLLSGLNSISDRDIQTGAFLGNLAVVDTATLFEREKESISELFKTMNAISETVKEVKEEEKKIIESTPHKKQFIIGYKSDEEVDLFEDGLEDIEDLEENDILEEDEDVEKSESIEEEDKYAFSDIEEDIDEGDENDFFENSENVENNFEDDLIDEDLESKDFSKFIGNDSDDLDSSFISKFEQEEKSSLPFFSEDNYSENEEEMGRDLNVELDDFTFKEEEPFQDSVLDDATDYFLTKSLKAKQKASEIEELKKAYKSKDKLKNSPDIEPIDDNLAKLLLAMGVAFMSLPSASAKLMEKLKGGSKKLKETMVVEDDEDE